VGHHPLHPCPAQTSYQVSGRDSTGMGHAKGSVFTESSIPVQLPAVALSYARPPSPTPTSMPPVVTQEKTMMSLSFEVVNDDDIGSELELGGLQLCRECENKDEINSEMRVNLSMGRGRVLI